MAMTSLLIGLLNNLRIACEIGILAFLIYNALLFVGGTRAETILLGITIVMIVMGFMSRLLGLEVIDWMLKQTWTFLALTILIIFQPEIRRAFAQIGSQQSRLRLHRSTKEEMRIINTLAEATFFLADHRIGALVAVERDIGTRAFAETGTSINAPLTAKLLTTLFFPNTPLHDGGVIVRDGVIAAAGCIFPLTQSADLSKSLGTRHRAGVGITEETDAVAIIVSEESGSVSLAYKGRLIRGTKKERLERHLINYLVKRRSRDRRQTIATSIADTQADVSDNGEAGKEPI